MNWFLRLRLDYVGFDRSIFDEGLVEHQDC